MNYTFAEKHGVKYISFPAFEKTGFAECAFSTRVGGVSPGGASPAPYDSLNLGFTTNDKIENVKKNREIFSKIIKNPFQNPVLQVHGDNVIKVEKFRQETAILGAADSLITDLKGITLTMLVADCLVVYIFDAAKKTIGIAHCGWRGLIKNIIGNMLKNMRAAFGTKPEDCVAAISPGIGPCCFTVDKDVYDEFCGAYPQWKDLYKNVGTDKSMPLQKWSINLNRVALRLLLLEKIKKENISNCNLCTSCNKDLFYSYRRDNADTGRMAGSIALLSA